MSEQPPSFIEVQTPEVSAEFQAWIEIVRSPESRHRRVPIINVDGLPEHEFHILLGEYGRVLREIGEYVNTPEHWEEGHYATSTNAPDSLIRPSDKVWTMQVRHRMQRLQRERDEA